MRRNVGVRGPERIGPSRVELLARDIEDSVFPDAALVIYLFSPFPAKLTARVVSNRATGALDLGRVARHDDLRQRRRREGS